MGAGPRKSGRSEGWTLRPPYLAELRIRGGTKRPKDTAMMRSIDAGGVQPVKVSMTWESSFSSSVATCWIGTVAGQWVCLVEWGKNVPSLRTFKPRPVGFAGRWTTSIDCMRPGTRCFTSFKARRDVMLKLSEPQNNIRTGSGN